MLAVGQAVLARCTAKTEGMKTGDSDSFAARARSALGTVLRGPLTGYVDEDGCAWEGTSSDTSDGNNNSSSKRNPLSDKDAPAVSDLYEVEFVLTAGDIGASSKALAGGKKGRQAPTSSIVVTVKELMQRQFIVSPALSPETMAALEKMGDEATHPSEVKPAATPTPTSTPSLEQLAKQASADKGKDKGKSQGAAATTDAGATPAAASAPATTQSAAKSQGLSGKGQAPAPTEAVTIKTQAPSKDPTAAATTATAAPAAAPATAAPGSGTEVAAKATNPAATGAPKDNQPQPTPQPQSDLVREFFVARVPTCATTLLTLQPSAPVPDTTPSQLPRSSRAGTNNASSSSSSTSAIVNPTTAAGLYCIGQLSCLKTVNSASGKDSSLTSTQVSHPSYHTHSLSHPLTSTHPRTHILCILHTPSPTISTYIL